MTEEAGAGFRIGFLVHDVSRLRQALFDGGMRPHGLTRAQWWMLVQLSRSADGTMAQSDLARLLGVGKVSVGATIARLEAAGFVRREGDASDRRVRRLALTGAGRRLQAKMIGLREGLNDAMTAGLTPEELAQAGRVLARMKANLSAARQARRVPPMEEPL
ncbi:MarR family winged helix-turn-helix transcriptional regulator [Sabulicella rubraurantiaca]|uniref:MarR family winged helix-turn-helix transcriptional regulator n=1 Tax=Sabulicella rubraurantiaca TaxID=2811429 RepID=UPI001A96E48C|nr:MarR family transcriptional regulator [Sabulicella rubraurantiaca]